MIFSPVTQITIPGDKKGFQFIFRHFILKIGKLHELCYYLYIIARSQRILPIIYTLINLAHEAMKHNTNRLIAFHYSSANTTRENYIVNLFHLIRFYENQQLVLSSIHKILRVTSHACFTPFNETSRNDRGMWQQLNLERNKIFNVEDKFSLAQTYHNRTVFTLFYDQRTSNSQHNVKHYIHMMIRELDSTRSQFR